MKTETTMEKIKMVAGAIVTIGASIVVGNAIKSTTPATTGKLARLAASAAGFVMASFVGEKMSEYTDQKIDEVGQNISIETGVGEDELPDDEVETA